MSIEVTTGHNNIAASTLTYRPCVNSFRKRRASILWSPSYRLQMLMRDWRCARQEASPLNSIESDPFDSFQDNSPRASRANPFNPSCDEAHLASGNRHRAGGHTRCVFMLCRTGRQSCPVPGHVETNRKFTRLFRPSAPATRLRRRPLRARGASCVPHTPWLRAAATRSHGRARQGAVWPGDTGWVRMATQRCAGARPSGRPV